MSEALDCRARAAQAALYAHLDEAEGSPNVDPNTMHDDIGELLTDIRVLCDRLGIDYHAAERASHQRYLFAIREGRDALDGEGRSMSSGGRGTGIWDVDPEFPVEDWRAEVQNDETRLGYWDWVDAQREAETEN